MSQAVDPHSPPAHADLTLFDPSTARRGDAGFAQVIGEILALGFVVPGSGQGDDGAIGVRGTPASTDHEESLESRRARERRERRSDAAGDPVDRASTAGVVNLPDPTTSAAALLRAPVNSASKPEFSEAASHDEDRLESPRREGTERAGRGSSSDEATGETINEPPHEHGVAPLPQNTAESVDRSGSSNGDRHTGLASSMGSDIGQGSRGAQPSIPVPARAPGESRSVSGAASGGVSGGVSGERRAGSGGEGALKSLLAPAGSEAGRRSVLTGPLLAERAHASADTHATSDETIVAQLGRGLAAALRQKGGSVLIRLAPEGLGQLRVHLTLEESQVTARLETTSPEARDLLIKGEDDLRAALESRGLQVKGVEIVNVGDESRANGPDNRLEKLAERSEGGVPRDDVSDRGGRERDGPLARRPNPSAVIGRDRTERVDRSSENSDGPTDGAWVLRVDMTA